jgi:hypothetical protein
MKEFSRTAKSISVALTAVSLLAPVPSAAAAAASATQTVNAPQTLSAAVVQNQTFVEIPIPLAAVSSLRLQVVAPVDGATLTLLNPAGAPAVGPSDPSMSALLGATLVPPLPGATFLTPMINSPMDGTWTLRLDFPAAKNRTVVLATVYAASPYQVGLVMDRAEYRAGQTVALGLIVLHDNQPISGLTPTIDVTAPAGNSAHLVGADTGNVADFDGRANDGIYSSGYTFAQAGTYTILGQVSIPTPRGEIARTVQAIVKVTNPVLSVGSIQGTVVRDATGCVSKLDVQAQATASTPGTYVASGRLTGVNGRSIQKSTNVVLSGPGPLTFDLAFGSDQLIGGIGTGGPYSLSVMDFLNFSDAGSSLEARRTDALSFSNIALSDLCSRAVAISPRLTVTQTLRDGYIQSLRFAFPVSVRSAGSYQVTFKVTGAGGREVQQIGVTPTFAAGMNTVAADVTFDRFQTVDGPYAVESVLVLGQGASAQASVVGSSGSLSRWQFYPKIVGDLNGDGSVDSADRAELTTARGIAALQPGDRRDLNRDGVIDIRDIRAIINLACTAGKCPTN